MAGAAAAALVLTAVSTAVSIHGQLQAGKGAKALAERNAQIREQEAKLSLQAREAEKKLDKKRFIVQSGANVAAAGDSGSAGFGDIFLADTAYFQESQLIRDFNAEVFAFGKNAQAGSDRFEGALAVSNSINSAIGTGFKGAAAIAGGAAAKFGPTTLSGSSSTSISADDARATLGT